MSEVKIEYEKLADISPAARNPKDHDLGAIQQSIGRFGFTSPVLVDERTEKLVAGHGRLEALTQMREQGQEPPERIEANGSDWLVPVIRGVGFRSDIDAEAYLVADNRLTQLGDWSEDVLADVLKDLAENDALEGVGYDADDVESMIKELDRGTNDNDPDQTPEPPAEPVTKRGDVWLLGKHRVMCGDSVSMTDVERLTDGEQMDAVITDPPYGVDIVKKGWVGGGAAYQIPFGGVKNRGSVGASKPFGSKENRGSDGATNMVKAGIYDSVIGDDSTQTATDAYNLCAGLNINVLIFWGGNYYASSLPDSSGWIVWDKDNTGNFADAELAWTNQDKAVRIFKHQWNGMLRASERGERRVHPTQKPVALAEWCIETYAPTAKRVMDLFAGSGFVLTACERKGVTAYLMELSEQYIDVIARRYQEYTGNLPVLESTGEAHDFTQELNSRHTQHIEKAETA